MHLIPVTKLRVLKKFAGSSPLQAGAEDSLNCHRTKLINSMGMMLPTNRSQVALFNLQKPGGCNYNNCKAKSVETPRGCYPQGAVEMVNRALHPQGQ